MNVNIVSDSERASHIHSRSSAVGCEIQIENAGNHILHCANISKECDNKALEVVRKFNQHGHEYLTVVGYLSAESNRMCHYNLAEIWLL